MQLVQVFDGRIVDVAPASLVVEICASEAKVDGLVEVLRPYGVLEMVRTGRVAMDRGSAAEASQIAPPRAAALGAGPSTSLGTGPSAADGLSCSV
jgi:acetolactate synthase-1/3 small subunit